MGVILHYESATYSRWLAKFTPFVVEHVGRAMAAHGGGDESAEQPIAAAAASELSPQGESALRAALAGGLKIELPIELGSVWRFPWYLNSVQVLLDLYVARAAAAAAKVGGGQLEEGSDEDEEEERRQAAAAAQYQVEVAEAAAMAHWEAWRLLPRHIDVDAARRERQAAAPGVPPCCYLEQKGITLLWPFGAPGVG